MIKSIGLIACLALAWSGTASAQPAPEDVQAAANAFAEGQRAQLRRDYARAAELFEIADSASPSAAALRSAIRNHRAAGHNAQAATLAVRARLLYGGDATTSRFADGIVTDLGPALLRAVIRCSSPCVLSIDGQAVSTTLVSSSEIFLDPGAHRLDATWTGRPPVSQTLQGTAGQTQEIVVQEPPAPPPAPPVSEQTTEPEPAPVETPPPPPPWHPPPSGLSPAVFWIGLGVTAVAGGILLWSGLDTLSARDDYANAPTKEGYDDGVGRELRTNVLIGVTAGLAAATLVVGLFATRWGGAQSFETAEGSAVSWRPTLDLADDRLVLGLVDSF